MIRIWRPRNLSSFQDPQPPLSIYVQNSSTSLTLDVQFQPTPTLTSPNDNQLIKRKYNPRWLLYVIRSFLQVGFRFQYQFILLKLHYLLFRGFMLFCVQLSKNITKYLLFIIIHIIGTYFAISLFYLHNLKTKANYGATAAPCMSTNETKTKTKPSHVTFKLTMRSIVRFRP